MLKGKRTYLIPILGFAILIIIGAILLYLPICNKIPITFSNALFTATSGITTTGFSKVTLSEQFTFFGQLVIAVLMEIGAMGFIIFISYFWSVQDKKIKMSDIILINDSISGESYGTIKEHSIFIGKFMLKTQIIGCVLLFFSFIPIYGPIKGIWYSIFHTISAFSNTGFDLIGSNSFIPFKGNIYTQIVITILMIVGSIGILVIEDIKNNKSKRFDNLKLQTKIVLTYSIFLLVFPTLFMKVLEPKMNLVNSLFMSATSRSTGFTVVNLENLTQSTKILLTILMFIGGGPTSTAGGVRIIVIAVVLSTIISTLRGKEQTIMFWRRIPESNVRRAFTIFILFIVVLTIMTIIMANYHNLSVLQIIFGNVSAISNTGLTLINMNTLNLVQEICIMILMFVGRVGLLSLVLLFFVEDKQSKFIKYPNENVIL